MQAFDKSWVLPTRSTGAAPLNVEFRICELPIRNHVAHSILTFARVIVSESRYIGSSDPSKFKLRDGSRRYRSGFCHPCAFSFIIFPELAKIVSVGIYGGPIFIFELTMGFWLLFKGLRPYRAAEP